VITEQAGGGGFVAAAAANHFVDDLALERSHLS
jgi:hypothetical protein